MKVSIITVSYNSDKTIRDTIESVLSQTHSDIEYIIIDGASSDKTIDVVRSYGDKIHTVVSEKDSGLYDAMNKGIQKATGDVIGILNSDDLYADENVLRDVVAEFDTSPIDGVYSDLVYVQEDNVDQVSRYWRSGEYSPKSFLNGWMPPHPTFFVRKECYDRFGTYNLTFKTSADYELMLRFIYKNHVQVGYLPRVTVKMRMGGQSNASFMNRLTSNKEDRRAWTVNGLKPRPYTLTMKPMRKIGQFFKKYSLN